jgi:hypothetical protein
MSPVSNSAESSPRLYRLRRGAVRRAIFGVLIVVILMVLVWMWRFQEVDWRGSGDLWEIPIAVFYAFGLLFFIGMAGWRIADLIRPRGTGIEIGEDWIWTADTGKLNLSDITVNTPRDGSVGIVVITLRKGRPVIGKNIAIDARAYYDSTKGVPKHKISQECGIMAAIRLGR